MMIQGLEPGMFSKLLKARHENLGRLRKGWHIFSVIGFILHPCSGFRENWLRQRLCQCSTSHN